MRHDPGAAWALHDEFEDWTLVGIGIDHVARINECGIAGVDGGFGTPLMQANRKLYAKKITV